MRQTETVFVESTAELFIETAANYFADSLASSGLTQYELGNQVGFKTTNVISLFRNGRSRIPFDRISAICLAINADESKLLDLCLREYEPELHRLVIRHYKTSSAKSENEKL